MNIGHPRITATIASVGLLVFSTFSLAAEDAVTCNDDAGADCIVITQSADTNGSGTNSASIQIDGDMTTIMPIDQIAQSGDNNEAIFNVLGNTNTVYFAQIGNSIVTMELSGDNNFVTLNDFGGQDDRKADLDLSVVGDGNDLEITAQNMYAVASMLEIDLSNSMSSFVKVTYDDFAEITATILGMGSIVEVSQDNSDMYADADNKNSVNIFVDSISEANEVFLRQYGVSNTAAITVVGSNNELNVNQMAYSYEDMKIFNDVVVEIYGDMNQGQIEQWGGDMMMPGSAFDGDIKLNMNGNSNEFRIYSWEGPSSINVNGSSNNLRIYQGHNDINIQGNSNLVHTDTFLGEHYDTAYTGNTSHVYSLIGDGNEVNYAWHEHGEGSLSTETEIEGNFNYVNYHAWDNGSGDGFYVTTPGSGDRIVSTRVYGNENQIEQIGYVMMGDGSEDAMLIDISVDGNANEIEFGKIMSNGLHLDLAGDNNSLSIVDTEGLFARVEKDSSVIDISSVRYNGMLEIYNYQNYGEISVSDSSGENLRLEAGGDYNSFIVQGAIDTDIDLRTWGSSNYVEINVSTDESRFHEVNSWIEGDFNSVIVDQLPEGLYGKLGITIIGDDNSTNFSSAYNAYSELDGYDRESFMYDNGTYTVDIEGNNNFVDMSVASSVSLELSGNDYNMSVSYNPDLGTYVQSIQSIGTGSIHLSTADGEVEVSSM